jgi:uncharacterized protein (TIGR02217 family)
VSLPVFPFRFSARPRFHEEPLHLTRIVGQNTGEERRAAEFGDDFKLRASGTIRLPQGSTSKTLTDWLTFVEATRGAYGTFLYSCLTSRYRVVTDEAVGTGDGSETVFYLDKKYINESSLVVKVSGVQKTGGGVDYTFSGNEVAPKITFNSAPAGAAPVTASYDFYFPVRFETEGYPIDLLASKSTDATRNVLIAEVSLISIAPGAHLA